MLLALSLSLALHAAPADYDVTRVRGNNTGLFVLGGFAVADIVVGALGVALSTDPRWKGRRAADLAWGVVNLGFAIVGLAVGMRAEAYRPLLADSLADGRSTQQVYAINTAFDLGYAAIAALAWNRVDDVRAKGFFEASLLQAVFLLTFDSAMALFHQVNNERALR